MTKLKNSKKFEKLEKRYSKAHSLLSQKLEERELMTREIDKEISKLRQKRGELYLKTMGQFYDEGGDM